MSAFPRTIDFARTMRMALRMARTVDVLDPENLAGWKLIGEAGGGSWTTRTRPRVDKHPLQKKLRWEAA